MRLTSELRIRPLIARITRAHRPFRARRLAVTDLTTTVLTLTLTGIAADSWLGGGSGAHTARRVLSVTAMLLGAFVGALLLLKVAPVAPVALAAALLAFVAAAATRAARREKAAHP